jgi:hypothetical protein
MRADMKTRFEAYEKKRLIGYDNIDGLRAMEDEAPLPDGAGQDYTPLPIASNAPVASRRSGSTRASTRGRCASFETEGHRWLTGAKLMDSPRSGARSPRPTSNCAGKGDSLVLTGYASMFGTAMT